MIPVKIQCECGQRYAFDVQPILGQMPNAVACPGCGADGTDAANAFLAQSRPGEMAVAAAPMRAASARIAVSVPPVAGPPLTSRGVLANPLQLGPEQAEHEARAKILWGDEPEEVIKYLVIKGVDPDEAAGLVGVMMKERCLTIRGNGIRKIVIGAVLACVPIVAIFIFARIGVISFYLLGIAVMVGLWGAWMIFKGIFMLLAPKSEAGDVAEQ